MHLPICLLFIMTMMGALKSSEGVKYFVEFTLAGLRLSNWDRDAQGAKILKGGNSTNSTGAVRKKRDSIGPYGDHYCQVWTKANIYPEEYLGVTETIPNDNQPWWHHEFTTYFIYDFSRLLRFEVWDDDPRIDDFVGGAKKEIKELCEQNGFKVSIQHSEVDITLKSTQTQNAGALAISHRIFRIDLEHTRAENGTGTNSSHKNHMALPLPYNIISVVLILTLSYFIQLQQH